MNSDAKREIYGVCKMSVRPHFDYTNALNFWRSVEEKYQQRKRRWMEANARMIASKMAAMRARRGMEAANLGLHEKSPGSSASWSAGCGRKERREDEEFSDVEPDMFADPAARYYSSLGPIGWDQIKADLLNIHRRGGNSAVERRRSTLRRLVLVGLILIACGVLLAYSIIQLLTTPPPPPPPPTTTCSMNCDARTILDDVIDIVIPRLHPDDEE